MKITAVDLKDYFLAQVNRYARAHVTVSSEYEEKKIQIERHYVGEPLEGKIEPLAVKAEVLPEHIISGGVYFSNLDITVFLNTAWEMMHNAKCHEIAQRVSNQGVTPQEVDSLIRDHGELFKQSRLMQERDTSPETGWTFTTQRNELTSFASRIFILTPDMTRYGKPCIVNGTVEAFETTLMGGKVNPTVSKIIRFVSSSEFATYISLAENSRYSAGILARTRMWRDVDGRLHDIIEVFFNEELMNTGYLNFWAESNLYLTVSYIEYPKPLTVGDILGINDQGQPLHPEDYRVIECDYGAQIAAAAAQQAMTIGQQ